MKLKIMLMILAALLLMPRLGAATDSNINFEGDGYLYVELVGQDIGPSSINSTAITNLGIRDDSLQVEGDFVFLCQESNPFSVDRFVEVAGGSAGFDQTYQGVGSYGTSVECYNGMGYLSSRRVPTATNTTFSARAMAHSESTISQYVSNDDPSTSVEVTESTLAEDCWGKSAMLVSWGSDSLYDQSFWWLNVGWDTENRLDSLSLYLGSYGFWALIRSTWRIPAIVEIIEYPEDAVLILKEPSMTSITK